MSSDYISTLKQTLATVRTRISARQTDIERLQREQTEDLEEEGLLSRLVDLKTNRHSKSGASEALPRVAEPKPSYTSAGTGGDMVRKAAIAALSGEGHPMHISVLHSRLEEMGVPIPGKGTQANVIAHLGREPSIIRLSRGIYGLKQWNLTPKTLRPEKSRPRRRGRSAVRRNGAQ
jgi:hypothetical protein